LNTPLSNLHFNLCNFCWWGRKSILCPQAQNTLVTPLMKDRRKMILNSL